MRIAVIGAGIVGLSSALWLLRDGHAVTIFDRVPPGDPAQASHGNAGLLAHAGVVPVPGPGLLSHAPAMLLDPDGPLFLRWRYLPRLLPWLTRYLATGREDEVRRISAGLAALVTDSLAQHRALAEGTGAAALIRESRWIHLFRSREDALSNPFALGLRREAGLRHEEMDRGALVDLDPGIGPGYRHGIAWIGGGHLHDPAAVMRALAEAAVRMGADLRRAEVTALEPGEHGVTLLADGGREGFDRVVLAAGAWSARLMKPLGHEPGLESERGYHLMLANPSRWPTETYMLADAKTAVTPMAGGLRLAGTVEFGGLEAGPSDAPIRLQRRAVRRLYPDLTWEGETTWMGHRPATIDSLPHLGPLPKAPGVIAAFGTQHLGITMGPRLGRLVADVVAGRRTNIDMAPYAPGRFDRGAARPGA